MVPASLKPTPADKTAKARLNTMASRLLHARRPHWAALVAMSLFALACQPIAEEPDAGEVPNHPPVLDEGGLTPSTPLVLVAGGTSNECVGGVRFSVGSVRDEDLDQTVQERWIFDYNPSSSTPDLGTTLTMQPVRNQPALRTDPNPAYVLPLAGFSPGAPHTVDVFISDGFDNSGSHDGGAVRPTDTLPDRVYLRHTWVVILQEPCAVSGGAP